MKIYYGAMTWIKGTSISALIELSATTETYSSTVNMASEGWVGAHVVPYINFAATPSADVKVRLYGSADGTNFDSPPVSEITINKATDPSQISLVVSGLRYWRLGFVAVSDEGSPGSTVGAAYCGWLEDPENNRAYGR